LDCILEKTISEKNNRSCGRRVEHIGADIDECILMEVKKHRVRIKKTARENSGFDKVYLPT